MSHPSDIYDPISFDDIASWTEDDHLAAFKAFLRSCKRLSEPRAMSEPMPLSQACTRALELSRGSVSRSAARGFFETYFAPHRVLHGAREGLVTGYYEPVHKGSRAPSAAFATPIYRRPPDLVNAVDETERGAKAAQLTHLRLTEDGRKVPYATRQDIDEGALAGRGLELVYLADPVDVFFMQVQGSGRIVLPDGTMIRVTYDGKNGHPYTSVGRHLIDTGVFAAEQVSLKALERWLKADRDRGRRVMWQNKSYVFFRELSGKDALGPVGAMSIPLSPGRSLAVDTSFHALGLPIWVTAPMLTHATRGAGFRRLMIAQDVGSAIRGPERGDIYFGSGNAAGRLAGVTKHSANFVVLLPKARDGGLGSASVPSRKLSRTSGP